MGKNVTMSSEYCIGCDNRTNPSGHPFGGYLAVDGNITNRIHDPPTKYFENCSRTDKIKGQNSWIEVDFAGLYTVSSITVFGNTDTDS